MFNKFQELYKSNTIMEDSQLKRRQLLLSEQKRERQNAQDKQRPMEEILAKYVTSNFEKHKRQVKQRSLVAQTFQETYGVELSLQQSEWLRERPDDLNEWLLVPCPKGQRSLVVAFNRHTAVYERRGKLVCIFHSKLPGDRTETDGLTILDCIYVRDKNEFYVLDVLAFGKQNFFYCEAEFRFFWLRSKWEEFEHLEQRSSFNQKPFKLVKQYDFENTPHIIECLQKYPQWPENKPQLDGFLFYHRLANYTCGSTPLVGWLLSFMVPDVLGLPVSQEYVKPVGYEDPFKYMDLFDEQIKMKRIKKQKRREKWEQNIKTENVQSDKKEKTNDDSPELRHNTNTFEECDDEDSLRMVLDAERALEMEQENDEIEEGRGDVLTSPIFMSSE